MSLVFGDAWSSIPRQGSFINLENHRSIEQRNFFFERGNPTRSTALRPLGVLFLLLFLAQLFLLPFFERLRSATGHVVLLILNLPDCLRVTALVSNVGARSAGKALRRHG